MSRAMTAPQPSTADWEAFYRSYRKPGYIPGYEISTKLGGGMFGLVFRARKQSIGKDYAIKFLKVDDGEVRRAVLQELEQVKYFAQVDHPNLVSIEDRGEVDGIPYIVMAYAGSETLRDRLAAEDPDRQELLRYFLQACRGVGALHERSLVHFDLKPANVFLKGGVARVGDYGLSKLVAHSRNSLSMGRGTPYYMAPEMLQRRGDQRSDIYSLGVMLYEILAGDVPFRGDSEWEVLRKHEAEEPRYPSRIPPPMRAVLQRCLAKDPAVRYQSVAELMAELGAPSSAGAAAFEEVRAGLGDAGTGAMPPPGTAAPPPVPPPPGPDDPYAGVRQAARKAQATARQVALEAMESARKATTQAMRDAHEAMQKALHRHQHRRQERRARRLARLRAREARREGQRTRPVPEGWPEIRRDRQHEGWWGALGIVLLVVIVLMWAGGGGSRTSARVVTGPGLPAAPVPAFSPPAPLAPQRVAADALELRQQVMRKVAGLRAEIARLRWQADQRPLQAPALAGVDPALQRQVEAFAGRAGYDVAEAERLLSQGYAVLPAAVAALQRIPVTDAEGLARAIKLHRLLQEATGFGDIALAADADLADNARAAALWGLFLQRVAPDAAAFERYLQATRR